MKPDQVKPVFDTSDVGCWIDGAFGLNHVRDKLQQMLIQCGLPVSMGDKELYLELEQSDSDHDVFDIATETLQEFTKDGLVWIWSAGDLILCHESEADLH